MNDYLNSLEPYKNIKEISDLIDEIHKLREYYYTQQHEKMQQHINNLMIKYLAETITWNACNPAMPTTGQQAYMNAETFLRAKGYSLLLKNGMKLQKQITNEELAFIESTFKPTK